MLAVYAVVMTISWSVRPSRGRRGQSQNDGKNVVKKNMSLSLFYRHRSSVLMSVILSFMGFLLFPLVIALEEQLRSEGPRVFDTLFVLFLFIFLLIAILSFAWKRGDLKLDFKVNRSKD